LFAVTPAQRASLQTGREPSAAGYPAGAVAYLRAHPASARLFNDYAWGGYLIYALYPVQPVFIDGRADVHGDALVSRYDAAAHLAPGWQQTLDDYQIGLVLMPADSPLSTALAADSAWQQVYGDNTARLFQRRAPAGQSGP
jgi:hypothetical protein